MKKTIFFYFIFLVFFYLLILKFFKPQVFTYQFNQNLVKKYFCSQDIPFEPPCKRLFLTDGEIHVAAGYLYTKDEDPTTYNFQHPPLIKYLYGYSTLLFGNPYYVQIMFGILFLGLTLYLGLKIYKNLAVPVLACIFLLVDPLFIGLSATALLDLGQGFFLLLYFLLLFVEKKRFWLSGVVLGLLLTSKFWGGSLFFIMLFLLYLLYKKKFNFRQYLIHLVTAFFVFCLVYLKTFVNHKGLFNIIFFELKVFKYWLHHSVTSVFGSNMLLFFTGNIKSWWGSRQLIRDNYWTILWPIGFVGTLSSLLSSVKKKIDLKFLISLTPILYLVYLGVQAPFSRYFILILPFAYLSLAQVVIGYLNNCKKTFP